VSVISIDSAPRSTFVRSLAEAGGGEAVFLTSDPNEEDITSALDRVLDTWSRPLSTDLALIVATGAMSVQARHAAGVTRSRFDLGDLPAGRSLWVSGAVSLYSEPTVLLQMDGQLEAERVISLDDPAPGNPEVRTLFGARQIARLERLEAQSHDKDALDALLDELGYANDPLRAPRTRPMYAENARAEGSIVHQLLVRESLRFGLVCSATAFVGERVEAGRRVEASVQVPNALPAGWSEAFVAGARAAMPAMLQIQSPPAPRMARARRQAAPSLGLDASFLPELVRGAPLAASPAAGAAAPASRLKLRYRGTPGGSDRSVVLAHGAADKAGARLSRLRAKVSTLPRDLAAGIELWVCLDDLAAPLIRVSLAELLALGGERPLNVAVPSRARVQLVLWLGDAAWPASAGQLEVDVN